MFACLYLRIHFVGVECEELGKLLPLLDTPLDHRSQVLGLKEVEPVDLVLSVQIKVLVVQNLHVEGLRLNILLFVLSLRKIQVALSVELFVVGLSDVEQFFANLELQLILYLLV